jgi:glycosyltransferase involved in cell wall biosynthesis
MASRGRTKVLWLTKGLGQGGMERLLVNHAIAGDRERFEYSAAYLIDRPHSVIDELRDLGITVDRLGSGSGADPRWLIDLIRLVRRERIDVVHAHSPMPAAFARVAVRLLSRRTRLVYTEHNRWDRFGKATRWANHLTFGLNDSTIAVSDDCRDTVAPRFRARVTTLVHGIDVGEVAKHRGEREDARAELGVDDTTVVIGTVANFRVQKNYPLLLEVAAALTAERPNVVFVAIGQGPLESELIALHSRLGLEDRFRFLGFRSDAHRLMAGFDVFCLSSDHEGLPVAVMEAKALGLPIVSTAVGGVPEAVENGRDGLVVPPRNPTALLGALRRVTDDPELRDRLAEASRNSSSEYAATRAVTYQEEVYGHF